MPESARLLDLVNHEAMAKWAVPLCPPATTPWGQTWTSNCEQLVWSISLCYALQKGIWDWRIFIDSLPSFPTSITKNLVYKAGPSLTLSSQVFQSFLRCAELILHFLAMCCCSQEGCIYIASSPWTAPFPKATCLLWQFSRTQCFISVRIWPLWPGNDNIIPKVFFQSY